MRHPARVGGSQLSGDCGDDGRADRNRHVAALACAPPAERSSRGWGGGRMSNKESCDKVLLIQAEFDGELDPVQSAAIVGHRQSCAACQEAWQKLHQARQAMRTRASYHAASDSLKRRIDQHLSAAGIEPPIASSPARPLRSQLASWWRSMIGFGLGAAIATATITLFLQPMPLTDMNEFVGANHNRTPQPGPLIQHTS